MAARCCMCLSRTLLSKYSANALAASSKRSFHSTNPLRTHSPVFSSQVFKHCVGLKAAYSSSQSPPKADSVKILSDEILKATQIKQQEKEKESEDGQKKKSDEFQRKAMKYTFLAFGSMFAGMVGLAVYEWGLY